MNGGERAQREAKAGQWKVKGRRWEGGGKVKAKVVKRRWQGQGKGGGKAVAGQGKAVGRQRNSKERRWKAVEGQTKKRGGGRQRNFMERR